MLKLVLVCSLVGAAVAAVKDTVTASLTLEVTQDRNLHTIDLVIFHDPELGMCAVLFE